MKLILLQAAEEDAGEAYRYYEAQRAGLGDELLEEFRRGVDLILERPKAWQAMRGGGRRLRLRRFPYGILYKADEAAGQIIVVAFMHMSRRPSAWRRRMV